jgi:hypothetical protein
VYLPPAGSVPPAEHFAFGLQAVVGAASAAELEDDVELEAVELEAVELEAVELETTTLLAKLEFGAERSALGFAAVRK